MSETATREKPYIFFSPELLADKIYEMVMAKPVKDGLKRGRAERIEVELHCNLIDERRLKKPIKRAVRQRLDNVRDETRYVGFKIHTSTDPEDVHRLGYIPTDIKVVAKRWQLERLNPIHA